MNFIRRDPIALLLIALPLAFLAEVGHWGEIWVFVLSAVGVVPMARYIGEATEALAHFTGPRIGGLLNATLGNAAELIITIFAIREGLLELVKASITGSILGNLLLVLGMSMVVGGIRHGVQSFHRQQASNNAVLLTLAGATLGAGLLMVGRQPLDSLTGTLIAPSMAIAWSLMTHSGRFSEMSPTLSPFFRP